MRRGKKGTSGAWGAGVLVAAGAVALVFGCEGASTCVAGADCAPSGGGAGGDQPGARPRGEGGAAAGSAGAAGAENVAPSVPKEDCSNAKDDDGDELVDLGDPDCARCVPRSLDGWVGPVSLYAGPASSVPACDIEAFSGGDTPKLRPLECTQCACQQGANVCEVELPGHTTSACSGTAARAVARESCGVVGSAYYRPIPHARTTCTPTGGELVATSPPEFFTTALGCELGVSEEGTCPADFLLADAPSEGFERSVCYFREGADACPEGFEEGNYFHRTVVDERACGGCACQPEIACTATLLGYASDDCSGAGTPLSPAGSCSTFAGVTEASARLTNVQFTGGCTPRTLEEEGSVSVADPITVCCRPY